MKKNVDNSTAFVNLDNDERLDVMSIREIADAIEGSSYAYGLQRELEALHADQDVQTPAPAIRFRGVEYWKAGDETVKAWKEIREATKKARIAEAESKSWTKAELVDVVLDIAKRKATYLTHDTKIKNREAMAGVEALQMLLQKLGGIPDTDKDAELDGYRVTLRKQAGFKD